MINCWNLLRNRRSMILDMLFMLEIGQVAGADLSSPGFLINGVTDTDLKAAGN